MIEILIAFLQDLQNAGPVGQLSFYLGPLLLIAGFIWGSRWWAARRYAKDIKEVADLRLQLSARDETVAARDAEIATLEKQLDAVSPTALLARMDRDAKDENLGGEAAQAEAWLEKTGDALHRAYATLTKAEILSAESDPETAAIAYENAALKNMGARAARPRDREAMALEAELAEAAAHAAQGLKVHLNEDLRAEREEARRTLPQDLQAVTDVFYRHRNNGRFRLMEMLASHGVDLASRKLGKSSREALGFHRLLAEAERYTGNSGASLKRLSKIEKAHYAAYGPKSIETPYFQMLKSRCKVDAGDFETAFRELRTSLELANDVLGENDKDTLTVRYHVARAMLASGDAEKAMEELEPLLNDKTRIKGKDHKDTLATRYLIASCLNALRRPNEAEVALQSLLEDYVRLYGTDHPSTVDTEALLAEAELGCGKQGSALARSERLLPLTTELLGQRHPGVLQLKTLIAHLLALRGDERKARDMLAGTVEAFKEIGFGTGHPYVLRAKEVEGLLET